MKKRIYYHDTDCGGVVYYGNYLKYLEEARTEFLEEKGISLKDLMDKGLWFAVRKQEIEYKAPAYYGDILEIKTFLKEITSHRIVFLCETYNQNGVFLNKAQTDLVCVDKNLKLSEIPKEISEKVK
ncbi:MAG: thioesterase family protein [Elusimicrobiota bacterium]